MNMPIERNKHYYLIANKVNNLAALRLLTLSATKWTGIGNAPDSFTRKTTVHSPYFFRSNVWMTFPLASMKCQANVVLSASITENPGRVPVNTVPSMRMTFGRDREAAELTTKSVPVPSS